MTNKQLHKVNSVMMMRNDKVDLQVVIKLSHISDEKYTYLQRVKSVMRRREYKVHVNDECTTPLSRVSSSQTQCKET